MPTVTESIDVDVPVQAAYNQWTQFESFPHFMNGVDEVKQLDDLRTHWKTSIGGVTREFDAETIEQVPDNAIVWNSLDGKSHGGSVRFQPIDTTHCRVTVELSWEADNLTEKVGAAVGADDRQVQSDLKRFKDYIEAQGHPDGAWRGTVVDGEAG
jgi:uncharacterized membrane protein